MICLTIRNKIIVAGASERVRMAIRKRLTLPNPLYWKLLRMGNMRALYAVPKDYKYYDEYHDTLYIGRGNYQWLTNYLRNEGYAYEEKDETTNAPIMRPRSNIKLREYQRGDIENITRHKNGIIKLGTGYGKTIIAIHLITTFRQKSIIIVPRDHLVKQFVETIERYTKIIPGVIQGNKRQAKNITIASIQTLALHSEIALTYQHYFGMLIVDECHASITTKRLGAIQIFNPRYVYGMTATPRRTDEQGTAIEFTYGPIIIDKELSRDRPVVKIIYTNTDILSSYNYAEIINDQIANKNRNQLIINTIHGELSAKRKILVLSKRIQHYRIIAGSIGAYRYHTIDSTSKSKDRATLLQDLREGRLDFDCILGTFSMLSTGTDIPMLDMLLFVGDLRSDVLQEQSAGRILRLFGNKQSPKIIDFIDNRNGILYHQGKARISWYKKQGWEIEI